MAVVQPDELTDPAIRRVADELGIAHIGRAKADLVQEILQKHPNLALFSAPIAVTQPTATSPPIPNTNPRWLEWTAIVLTAFTALFTAYTAWANADSAKTARDTLENELTKGREGREKEAAEAAESSKRAWQTVILYKILDAGTKANPNGMTLGEIQTKYQTEAASAPHDLAIKDKDELAIRRLLLKLMETHLVISTPDDRYVARLSIPSTEEACRGRAANAIRHYVINLLAKDAEAGRRTVSELATHIIEIVKEASLSDANCVIASLVGAGVLYLDTEKKVWSIANPQKIPKGIEKAPDARPQPLPKGVEQ